MTNPNSPQAPALAGLRRRGTAAGLRRRGTAAGLRRRGTAAGLRRRGTAAACSVRHPSKSQKYEHIVIALKRSGDVDNPFAVGHTTYRKMLAHQHKMVWVRHVRAGRTLASFVIKPSCLKAWGAHNARVGDLIIVYSPTTHSTQTLRWER